MKQEAYVGKTYRAISIDRMPLEGRPGNASIVPIPCPGIVHLGHSIELLEVSLSYQTLDVTLPDIELAVLGQVDCSICPPLDVTNTGVMEGWALPIFRLNLPCILQYANVNE